MGAPSVTSSSGDSPVTVARVPTGMKAGVSIVPRGVCSTPRRARPSRLLIEKGITPGKLSAGGGEFDRERRPRPRPALHRAAPAVGLHDLAHEVKPQPQAAPLGQGGGPLERLEDS